IIYHEAEIWGAALAIGAFDCIVAFLITPSRRSLVLAGCFSTLSILTRGSVGAGPVIVLGLLGAVHTVVALRRRWAAPGTAAPEPEAIRGAFGSWSWLGLPDGAASATWAVGLLVALAVPVVLYVAINEVKFHTLVSLPLNKQVFTSLNANRRLTLADNGGSLFGVKFIPTGLLQYLRPDALRISRLFPFLAFGPKATMVGHVHYDTRDFSSSITTTMPALVALGLAGLFGVFGRQRRRRLAELSLLRLPIVGAGLGTVGVLAIAFIANRYLADFMPVLVLSALAGVALAAASWRTWNRPTRAAVGASLAILALIGVWANVGLGLLYQRELRPSAPLVLRAEFVSLQQRIDTDLFASSRPEVTRSATLGRLGAPGSLVIVGDCDGLYQSDGNEWRAVERSRSDGHFVLRVVFPSDLAPGYWPILVNGSKGAGDFLAVRSLGGHEFEFAYLFEGLHQRWIDGSPFRATPGRPYRVDAVFDSLVHQVLVHVDASSALSAVLVRSSRPIWVGSNPLGGPVGAAFPGSIEQLAVPTPICSGLLRRLEAHP
ncbi:MAG: hypothetical protein ACRDVW_06265, partial [Acidimicrobiales bacterium]